MNVGLAAPRIVTALAAVALLVASAGAGRAPQEEKPLGDQERAERVARDASRIGEVRRVALAPPVIQLRFDRDRDVPDPDRMKARNAVASRVPVLVERALTRQRKDAAAGGWGAGPGAAAEFTLAPPEESSLALRGLGWKPTDLYVARADGTWDSPAEVVRNRKRDEAALLSRRETMKANPAELTLFHFKWHDLPDEAEGLAAFDRDVPARFDVPKVRSLGEKVSADAVLLVQVGDMEVFDGRGFLQGNKSVRLHLHATLLAARDGAVLWRARARGTHSHKIGLFRRPGGGQTEEGMAIEAGYQATRILVDDLCYGRGKPAVPEAIDAAAAR